MKYVTMKLVDFTITPEGLKITLLPDGKTELLEMVENKGLEHLSSDAAFAELIEFQLGNGWEWISPEDIGALTGAEMLSNNAQRNDAGQLTAIETVYYWNYYQLQSPARALLEDGSIVFTAHNCHL